MTKLQKYLNELKPHNIHIVGVSGTEGSEIAIFLHNHKIQNVTLHDFTSNQSDLITSFQKSQSGFTTTTFKQKLSKFLKLPYPSNYKNSYLKNIETADLIFIPQSWYLYPVNNPLKPLLTKIPFSSLTELYLKLAPCPIIGITGSNGKSTTTFLIHHLLKAHTNKKIHLTGNDRRATQILTNLHKISKNDLIVTEISNRQLHNISNLSPHIAVLLNITENHLSEHSNFQEYIDAKARITLSQSPKDHLIYNSENPICNSIAKKSKAQLHPFGANPKNKAHFNSTHIFLNQKPLIAISKLPLKGEHNLQNICAAILAAHLTGLSPPRIAKNLTTFTGLPQRIEILKTPPNPKSLTFIDDRQGTSTESTIMALRAVPKPITIILGGQNKGMPTKPLIKELNHPQTTSICITSPFSAEITPHLKSFHETKTLTQAIKLAIRIAKPNSTILFSPACEYGPYFNPLPGYKDAEKFREIVEEELGHS